MRTFSLKHVWRSVGFRCVACIDRCGFCQLCSFCSRRAASVCLRLWRWGEPRAIVDCLDRCSLVSVWKQCHGFLIENQLPINTKACKIQSCIMTYFKTLFGNFKLTLAISSKLKTAGVVCATKRERKLHCVQAGRNLVADAWPEKLDCLDTMTKRDDICDAVCQWFAFL